MITQGPKYIEHPEGNECEGKAASLQQEGNEVDT